jgi:hypothetical protein
MKPALESLSVTDGMTPIYQSRNVLLIQADACALPFGEIVDLAVTSPPYGAGIAYDGEGDVPSDSWETFTAAWLAEVYRVTKPSGRLALVAGMMQAPTQTGSVPTLVRWGSARWRADAFAASDREPCPGVTTVVSAWCATPGFRRGWVCTTSI